MANATAALNAQLFNQLAGIYGQMGRGVPGRPPGASGGKGRYTNWLRNLIGIANQELAAYQQQQYNQQLQAQQAQAAKAMADAQKNAMAALESASGMNTTDLKSTLGSGGVRRARSATQRRAQEQGVRAANVLSASQYINPTTGGLTAKPPGGTINLA